MFNLPPCFILTINWAKLISFTRQAGLLVFVSSRGIKGELLMCYSFARGFRAKFIKDPPLFFLGEALGILSTQIVCLCLQGCNIY